MMNRQQYAAFTNALVRSLESDERVLGIVALGSMASIDYEPDEWSDHDFFLISTAGDQESLRSDLSWLPEAESIAYSFRETRHGLKVLYRSGHLLEFAVFDKDELSLARVNRYRVLLDRDGIAQRMASVAATTTANHADESVEYLWGQFLTNILVGAGRCARGERLSGADFIRGHAVRHLLMLLRRNLVTERASILDNLDLRRRYELVDTTNGPELARITELPALDAARALLKLAAETVPGAPLDALAIVDNAVERARRSAVPSCDDDTEV